MRTMVTEDGHAGLSERNDLLLRDGAAKGNGNGVALDGEVAPNLDVENNLACVVAYGLEAEVVDVRVRPVVARGRNADVDLARHVGQVRAALTEVGDQILQQHRMSLSGIDRYQFTHDFRGHHGGKEPRAPHQRW